MLFHVCVIAGITLIFYIFGSLPLNFVMGTGVIILSFTRKHKWGQNSSYISIIIKAAKSQCGVMSKSFYFEIKK